MKTMTSRFNPAKNIAVSVGFLSLLAPLSAYAGTTTIFAPGVTFESGWYDVNKKSTEHRPQKDFAYCWAATASNLIRWWQDRYVASGAELPDSVPDGKTSELGYTCGIFDIFLDENNWNHVVNGSPRGADPHVALKWYFNGENHNFTGTYAVPISGTGGFWGTEYVGLQSALGHNFIGNEIQYYSSWGPWAEDQSKSGLEIFSGYVRDLLSKGAAGMAIQVAIAGGLHAVTLWGADFDAAGLVTAVYMTDSDDAAKTLLQSGLRKYSVTTDSFNRSVSLKDSDYGTVAITGLTGLTAYPVPEPSAFGLLAGLGAFALGVSRRRR